MLRANRSLFIGKGGGGKGGQRLAGPVANLGCPPYKEGPKYQIPVQDKGGEGVEREMDD